MKKITLEDLKIDPQFYSREIGAFLSGMLEESGANGYVIGVSGGVDSSTVLALLVEHVGADKILALIMPDRTSTPLEDIEDALSLVKKYGVKHHIVYINDILEAYRKSIPEYEKENLRAEGNVKARIRMTILYYHANKLGYLVCGTGDKSELLIGYFTKYGDGGVDLLPIGDLYKTQVRQLAKSLGLPDRIAYKPSSPRLWPGHKAEKELGLSYNEIDLILYTTIDLKMNIDEASKSTGIAKTKFERVLELVKRSKHKRTLPPVPRIGFQKV